MTNAIEFVIPGDPATKGSTVSFAHRGRVITKADCRRLVLWSYAVATCARQARVPLIPKGAAVAVSVFYEFRRPDRCDRSDPCVRPDIDKLARALLDALKGIAFDDDGQVTSLVVKKIYGAETRTRVLVGRPS